MAGTHKEPQSPNEAILQNILGEQRTLRDPQSRIEKLLLELLEYISNLVGISFEVVEELPATGATATIYLVPNSGSGTNSYDEYIYVNDAYEKIGSTEIDLSGYQKNYAGDSTAWDNEPTNNSTKPVTSDGILNYINGGFPYLTTAPTANNTSGRLKVVVMNAEPATRYDGYIYIITGA